MKMRSAGRLQRIGLAPQVQRVALLAFALAFLACGAAIASDVERQIPLIRDAAGSGLTVEISREGTRQTATPFVRLYNPTVERIEDRIAKLIARLVAKETPAEEAAADAVPRIGMAGTPRDDSGQPGTSLSSRQKVPEEITVRSVESFLKGLRAPRKEKPVPVPAAVVAVPEQRLGMTAASPGGAY